MTTAGPAPACPPHYGVAWWRLVFGLFVLPLIIVGGSVLFALSSKSRLPVPIASHFAADGHSNGTMSLEALGTSMITMALVLWALALVPVLLGRSARVRFRAERAAIVWCIATATFSGAVITLTVLVNLGQPSAATARMPAIDILVVLAIAVLGGLVGWAVAGPAPALAPLPTATLAPAGATRVSAGPPPLTIRAGEHPVWQQHLTSPALSALAIGSLLLGAGLLLVAPIPGVILLFCGVATTPVTTITTVVDGTGLSVRFGPLAWPRRHIGLDQIRAASAEDIEPLEWGGWGYRVVPGRTAVVLRRGPALVIDLTDGRRFAVTVDAPEGGAQLLDAYRRDA